MNNWNSAWRKVAVREMKVKLTDRNFLISTVFGLLLMVAIFGIQSIFAMQVTTIQVGTIQGNGAQVTQAATALATAQGSKTKFETIDYPDRAALLDAIEKKEVRAGLVIDGEPSWTAIGLSTKDSDVETYIGAAVTSAAVASEAQAHGVDLQAVAQASTLRYTLSAPDAEGLSDFERLLVGLVFAMLFYMASLMFGLGIAQSVVEEKQSRIVEILATAIPTRQLLVGKILGNSLLALAQIVLLVGCGLIGLKFSHYAGLSARLVAASVWFVVFFLVGFIVLACLWSVAGALAGRSEDLQSTSTPMSLLVVAVMMVGLMATGKVQLVFSFVPLVSSVCMPSRIAGGGVAWWEPLVAIVLTVIACLLVLVAAERVYRQALLMPQRVSIRQVLSSAGH